MQSPHRSITVATFKVNIRTNEERYSWFRMCLRLFQYWLQQNVESWKCVTSTDFFAVVLQGVSFLTRQMTSVLSKVGFLDFCEYKKVSRSLVAGNKSD
jgi:hypothetical protein